MHTTPSDRLLPFVYPAIFYDDRPGTLRKLSKLCDLVITGVAWGCLVRDRPNAARVILVSASRQNRYQVVGD